MVNALTRTIVENAGADTTEDFRSTDLFPFGDERSPCALREFVNSIADLPNIEELAKGSKSLAMAMGML